MKKLATVTLGLVFALAAAQDRPASTRAAWNVAKRYEASLGKVVKGVTPHTMVGDSTPLTRGALVLELERVFDQARPSFRWTPVRSRVVESAITGHNPDPKVQAAIRKLARFGCVAPVGPLVVGPSDTLTLTEVGDALGLFLVRVAHLTHQPDPKWSPNLTFDTGT